MQGFLPESSRVQLMELNSRRSVNLLQMRFFLFVFWNPISDSPKETQPVLTLSLLRVIMTSIFYVHFLARYIPYCMENLAFDSHWSDRIWLNYEFSLHHSYIFFLSPGVTGLNSPAGLANNTFGVWFWIHSMVMTNLEKLFFYLKDGWQEIKSEKYNSNMKVLVKVLRLVYIHVTVLTNLIQTNLIHTSIVD